MPSSSRFDRLGRATALVLFIAWAASLIHPGRAGAADAPSGSFPPPEYTRGVLLSANGDHAAARDQFFELLRKNPDDTRVADRLAREYIRAKDVQSGLIALKKFAQEHPQATAPIGALAMLSEGGRHWADAEAYWREAVARGSRHPEHLYGLMGALHRAKKADVSLAVLDSLSAAWGSAPVILYARGIRAWLLHDLDTASDFLDQAVRADPDLYDAAMTLGNIQHQNQATTASFNTWSAALKRAGEVGDRESQFLFLDRLGEAYWNAMDPRTIATLEEAIPLGEDLGELDEVGIMRSRVAQVELDRGSLDGAAWWGLQEVQHNLEHADSAMAAQRLAFWAGALDIAGDRWMAAGMYERALRLLPLERGTEKMTAPAARLARLLLRLGDVDGAQAWANHLNSLRYRYAPNRAPQYELLMTDLTLAQAAYLTGNKAKADSLYRSVIERPVTSMGSDLKGEAGICLARLQRESGDLAGAGKTLERARTDISVAHDSTLTGMAEAETMALLWAQGDKAALGQHAQALLGRSGGVLPVGLQPKAAIWLARLALPDHPDQGLDYLLQAWRIAEKEREHPVNVPIVEAFQPDPEEPLERLALFFAQLAVRPGDAPDWTWKPAKDTSHSPGTPAGALAARWSYFFAERRAARILEYNLSTGYGGPLPKVAPATRFQLWDKVAERARDQARALVKGEVPKNPPGPDQPLLADLTGPARDGVVHGVPEYERVPWLIFPAETNDLQRALAASRETIVRTASFEPLTLLYILTQDRLRIVAVPLDRTTLAQKVQKWVPYRSMGCTTPGLDTLPTSFDTAGELFNDLLGPVGESADLTHTVWIAADGALWYLPFESLAPRGGNPKTPDKGAVLEQPASFPLALDQYKIAYLLDPGALLAGAESKQPGSDARFVLPVIGPDGSIPAGPEVVACQRGDTPAANWRQPPCEPAPADLDRLMKECAPPVRQVQANETDLARMDPTMVTVVFCPVFQHPARPWEGGILVGGTQDRNEDGYIRWSELARLSGAGTLVLPEAGSCAGSVELSALTPSRWGGDVTMPALDAAFAGYRSLVQTLWNAGEASWIPLAGCLRDASGPTLATFLTERRRLRGATIPAGPGHTLALGHPFFSCATRWWQLSPAGGR